jgi:hypothetical protein
MTRRARLRRVRLGLALAFGFVGMWIFPTQSAAQIGPGDPNRDNRGQLLYHNEASRALGEYNARRNQDSLERTERGRVDAQRRFDDVRTLERSLAPGERLLYRERRLERVDVGRAEQNARDKVERTPPAPEPTSPPLP